MFCRAMVGAIVLLASAGLEAGAQEIKLQWKFKEGETIFVEDTMNMTATLSVQGQAVTMEEKTVMVTSYTIKKVAADSVVMDMKIIDVDKRSKGSSSVQADRLLENCKGAAFTVTMTPDGKVTRFEGFPQLLKKLEAGNEDTGKLIKQVISEDTFTEAVGMAFGFMPEKAVKNGDTWDRAGKFSLGPLGSFKTTNSYTYKGPGDGGQQIGLKKKMVYEFQKGADIIGVKITKGDLKADKSKGNLVFDAEKGRLVSASLSLFIRGALTIELGNNEVPIEIVLDTNASSRVYDKNPVKD
jgi:hypothetical protein